jgi:hypothetical protein
MSVIPFLQQRRSAMPRFFINFVNADQIAKDEEGVDLPSLEDAREAAMASARELIADSVRVNAKDPVRSIIITGEGGESLMTISAKDVLPEPLKQ